ncbi:MAG: alpha-glucosidase/alpha-galactosidase [Symbiobacteriaceae bacterium]|nr:alpha-glucosidase/alpha-galactosidase [Symbiobacteriaceae bacterium]
MLKIALIGAGSILFTRRLLMDILAVEEFRDTEFRFMDVNEENLMMVTNLCRKLIEGNGLPATIVPTTDRRRALDGANYVLSTAKIGGLKAMGFDVEIPLKYGVDQCVGDTLAPGGIMYGLRSIPFLLDLAADMRDLCPDALLIQYQNPMAINQWGLRRAGAIRTVGLCHGVQGTTKQIARVFGLPMDELHVTAAGINHQTWFLQVDHNGRSLLPEMLERYEQDALANKWDRVRIDVMRRFGYYSTESNGHLSEYLPWYRKRPNERHKWFCYEDWPGGITAGCLDWMRRQKDEFKHMYPKWMAGEGEAIPLGDRSWEHASYIIEALELGRPYRGHLNIGNHGVISNLPDGCTVEVPCIVDRDGIRPEWQGPLPLQVVAPLRASVSVQELTVEAALTGDVRLLKLALLNDPLTAASCNTEEVWAMADELLAAEAEWLPQFGPSGPRWEDRPAPPLYRPHSS